MSHASEALLINLLKHAVETQGCVLTEVNLENKTLKVDGSDENVANCARAVAEIIE